MTWIGAGFAILALVLAPLLRRMMHGVKWRLARRRLEWERRPWAPFRCCIGRFAAIDRPPSDVL